MKELGGTAAATIEVPGERCIELLAAVERYPEWYPEVILRAEVLERDRRGRTRAAATVHVAVGPLNRDFELLLDVEAHAQGVRLVRIPYDPADGEELEIEWVVNDGDPTRLQVALHARLDIPRLVPLKGIGDAVAQGFVKAAKSVLEGSSEGSSPKVSASSS